MADDQLKPWTVISRRTIIRDRWIALEAQTCVAGDGQEIAPFYVLSPSNWSAILAIDADDHAILVRQYRHGAGKLSLELPGGVIDATDADPAAAALRELSEETGYRADHAKPAGTFAPNPHNQTNTMHVFIAEGAVLAGKTTFDIGEAVIVERHPVASLGALIARGEVIHGLHIAAISLALAALGR